jgi:P4 family phage/plasmid primase-like protien
MTSFKQRAVSLVENGYGIIPIDAGSKAPLFKDWRQYQATVEKIESQWASNGNIGILTDATPAIDIDCLDEAFALEFERYVIDVLGEAPTRVGRAPKRLLLFRTNEPFRKIDSGFFVDGEGTKHKCEVLGQGQQFVAFGIHPDTKKPYKWISLESPADLVVEDLPLLDQATAQSIVDEFVRRCEARGWQRKSDAVGHHEQDEFWFLRPKPEATDDEIEAAVRLYANPGRDYDLWVKVGAALHDHYQGDERGFSLWDEWSSRSDLYSEELTRSKWKSFGRYTGQPVTIGFLLGATRKERVVGETKKKVASEGEKRDPLMKRIAECEDADMLLGDILAEVAMAGLDPLSEEMALKEINARRKKLKAPSISIHTLKGKVRAIRAAETDLPPSLGLMLEKVLADKVLEMCFNNGDTLLFFAEMWWNYRNGAWLRSEENMVAYAVQEAILKLNADADETTLQLAAQLAESRGDRLGAIVTTVVTTIKRMVGREGGDDPLNLRADMAPMVINCTNGELWFDQDGSYKFKKHQAEHHLTSQIACAYDPKATCPTWDGMCAKVFQSCLEAEDAIRHFHEVFGYLLQPDRHQAMWVLMKGPGGNGKSTLTRVISNLMGNEAVVACSIAEMAKGVNSHFTDSLQGKLMLLDDDFKAKAVLPDDWVKKLSEAKPVQANPKFGRPFTFTARCSPVILSNSWPQTTDLSDGIRRRVQVFETSHVLTAAERDPTALRTVLEKELPGVLNRLIAGLVRVLKRRQAFEVPYECEAAKQKWITMSNSTTRFVALMLDHTGKAEDSVSCTDLYDAYRQWAKHDEMNIRELGRNTFYEAMEAVGLKRRNHSGLKRFVGVLLKPSEAVDASFFTS